MHQAVTEQENRSSLRPGFALDFKNQRPSVVFPDGEEGVPEEWCFCLLLSKPLAPIWEGDAGEGMVGIDSSGQLCGPEVMSLEEPRVIGRMTLFSKGWTFLITSVGRSGL